MSGGDVWAEREKALEKAFFLKRDQELLTKLRDQMAATEKKAGLRSVSGITDDAVLDHLVSADIGAETVAALALVPLVAVAWADNKIDDAERKAILSASESEGIAPGTVCYNLLQDWLSEEPEASVVAAWKDYVGAIAHKLGPGAQEAFKSDVLGRATKVARAAGGVLGLSSISANEQRVLDDLESAFSS